MAEIRHITTEQRPSRGGDFVLIEQAGSGKFVASSVFSHRASDIFYAPDPVEEVQTAIAAANTWADLNGVPVVFVVEGGPTSQDNNGVP